MHKYQPRIHVATMRLIETPGGNQSLSVEKVQTFWFPETSFIAVTAYQNQLVSFVLHAW